MGTASATFSPHHARAPSCYLLWVVINGTHLPAANNIMSRLSSTIDLRGVDWRAFCSKGEQI